MNDETHKRRHCNYEKGSKTVSKMTRKILKETKRTYGIEEIKFKNTVNDF